MTSYMISPDLYLVRHTNSKDAPSKPVEVPVDHILVFDCSGSMAYDLPKIREQMKRKLPKMLGANDRVSMVWFSGKGQYGTLLEAEPVSTLSDLQQVYKAIDRWLVPVGMTGFKQPLEEVAALSSRLTKTAGGRVKSLLFFTDGCDNQWSTNEVLKAVEGAAGTVQAATFVEYGYYANRPLLAQMAERSGGSHIFAETFDRFEPQFEAFVTRKKTSSPRIEVSVKGDPIGGFAFALTDGDLVTYSVNAGKISVPKDLGEVYYLSPSCVGTLEGNFGYPSEAEVRKSPVLAAAYAAVSLFSVRMKPDVVLPILKGLGDVTLIQNFANCFGKQKYSAFTEEAKSAAFDNAARYTNGYNPNLVPPEDAFTVLDVLALLHQDRNSRVLLDDLSYSRIGRGRLDTAGLLTDEEQKQIDELTAEMGKTKDAKRIRTLAEQIAVITDKPGALKFERHIPKTGLPISSLTFNEDRPNVSFLVKIPGTINLSERIEKATVDLTGVPTVFQCFQFRNYTVIKDGLVNIDKLPVVVSRATYDKLIALGAASKEDAIRAEYGQDLEGLYINLKALPVINRKMVRELSAKTFFSTCYELTKAKAAQKVYKDFAKLFLPEKTSQGYTDKYGEEPTAWLKEQGITDYNGFQPPHTTQAPTTDVYTGKELKVSLKGLSTLPKVADVVTKLAAGGKLNAPGAMMAESVKEAQAFMASTAYVGQGDKQPEILRTWLGGRTDAAIARARELNLEVAKGTFCTVVGQVWFKEFSSIDETELTINVDGNDIACKVEMKEVQIAI